MRVKPTFTVGPHAYKLNETGGDIYIWYCLFNANGYRVNRDPHEPSYHEGDGKTNAYGWVLSVTQFPTTARGVAEAHTYAENLLRPQDEEND